MVVEYLSKGKRSGFLNHARDERWRSLEKERELLADTEPAQQLRPPYGLDV